MCSFHCGNMRSLHLPNCGLNEALEVLQRQCLRLNELFLALHTLGFDHCNGNNLMERALHSNHTIKNLSNIGASDDAGRTVASITRQLNLQRLSLQKSYLEEAGMRQIAAARIGPLQHHSAR